jgi:hypothetical protein
MSTRGTLSFDLTHGYFVRVDGSAETIQVPLPNIERSLVEGDSVAVSFVEGVPHCTRSESSTLNTAIVETVDLGAAGGPPETIGEALKILVPTALPSADQVGTALLWLFYFGLASATAMVMGPASHNMGIAARVATVAATLPAPGS